MCFGEFPATTQVLTVVTLPAQILQILLHFTLTQEHGKRDQLEERFLAFELPFEDEEKVIYL